MFFLVKFIEMKYLDKELKPLKFLVRDAVIVFVCSLAAALFVFNMDGSITYFFNVLTDTKTLNIATTQIFTDEPGF